MEYFLTVAAKRNITKAAEELHITQQTLSAHIAAVEKELACQLIVRSNPLQLTYAGEVFLQHASSIYGNYQAMWNEFNDLTNNQRGKLLIGVNFTRSHAIMSTVVRYLSAFGVPEDHFAIDLAIARFPESLPGMEIRDFYQDEVIMLAPKRLLSEELLRGDASIRDLQPFRAYPFVLGSPFDITGQFGRDVIHSAGFQPIVKAQSSNMETLLALCVKGVGICFCSESLARAVLTRDQLSQIKVYHLGKDAFHHIRFGYRKESYQWKMISEFIRIALEAKRGRG